MYVILTSKPGQFRTEIGAGLKPLDAYDYLFYGQKKAHFVIAVLNVDSATAQIVFGALILLTVALYGRERRMRDRV